MEERQQEAPASPAFEAWCVLELFGHKRLAGRVTEVVIAGQNFLRVDVPADDGVGWKAQSIYAPKSVYGMHPTTEEHARACAKAISYQPPVSDFELRALTAGGSEDYGGGPLDHDDNEPAGADGEGNWL